MLAFFVILFTAAGGSVVCLSAAPAFRSLTPGRQDSDPILRFGFILAVYGLIAVGLVGALPGALAMQRTALVFALLCVGGLVGEISRTGSTTTLPTMDRGGEAVGVSTKPLSPRLSFALMTVLDLAFAVLLFGQGLIDIVPPHSASTPHAQVLEPIVVVAQRNSRF